MLDSGRWPLRIRPQAGTCTGVLCVIERMTVYLCASFADRGRCSVTCTPGNAGRDRFELAAVLRLRVRLRIEGVHLAHAASEEQMDDRDIVTLLRLGLRLAAHRPA